MGAGHDPVITLLTDFGTADPYVGVCKGVIASRCPAARVIDLTHEIQPGNVHAAGLLLAGAWRYFPAGTVHLAVVDPGVGTGRRILAAEVEGPSGAHRMVAPDNGLLSDVFDEADPMRIVQVDNESLWLDPVSSTFHGRDIFSPVAAALAGGTPLDELGPATGSWIHLPRSQPTPEEDGTIVGEVVYIDRFGNLVTNVRGADIETDAAVTLARHTVHGIERTYGSVDNGALLALIGSTGRLEVSVNGGSAAGLLGVDVGARVTVRTSDHSGKGTA